MDKIEIIQNAINRIQQLNYNGLQINSNNHFIVKDGKAAIKLNSPLLIDIVIRNIANNENGFKYMSINDPETKYSLDAKKYLQSI